MASTPGRGRRLDLRLDRRGEIELQRALASTLDRIDGLRRAAQERAATGSSRADNRVSFAVFMTKRRDP
jgi:hypothetical protein